MSGKQCLNCTHVNPEDAKFCGECGNSLTRVATPTDQSVGPKLDFTHHVPTSLRDGLRALDSIISYANKSPCRD